MKYANAREMRFRKALRYNKFDEPEIDAIIKLVDRVIAKGMSQNNASPLIDGFLGMLEPPNCWMHHCPDYGGVTCFCNCKLAHRGNLIPGRCNRNKEFKAQQKAKVQKAREKSYEAFKEKCRDYPCVHYTGSFCEHMEFNENNEIKACKKAEVKK